jgi:hypothetical protein
MIVGAFIAASLAVAAPARAAYVTAPPGAPSWWEQTDTPFYSFYYNQGGSITLDSNEGTGFPITLHQSGSTITIDMPNGYDPNLHKQFYFYFQGSTSSTQDPAFVSMTAPNDATWHSPVPNSVVDQSFSGHTDTSSHTWYVADLGTAYPQPDRVEFVFNLPSSTSTITDWWTGEQCLPSGTVPEPAMIGLWLAAGALLLRRRR